MKSIFLALLVCLAPVLAAQDKKVRVYVLAGQSNMEGKVQKILMDHQATDDKTKDLFAHLRDGDGWIERDDVLIKFLGKKGGLTTGYGSGDRTGVELEFGWTLGDHHDEPVLLIKTAWGGHSLYKLFRSPSAGFPEQAFLDEELGKAKQKVARENEKWKRNDPMPTMKDIKAKYGSSYRNMMTEVNETLTNLDTLFPSLKGREPEISGFVWFQGWNDQYNGAEQHYASNLEHFINDVRKDLKKPGLPFVIGVMGQNGSKEPKGAMLAIQQAQEAMEKVPGFEKSVKAVHTDVLVDKAAEQLYPTWKKNFEEWKKTGSDHPYHYLGSAIWHLRMGKAFAEAMMELEGAE